MTTETSARSTEPRNRGLLARDLTEACRKAWYSHHSTQTTMLLDTNPPIRDAERAICDRIGELEQIVERQAKVLARMKEIAEKTQRELTLAQAALDGAFV